MDDRKIEFSAKPLSGDEVFVTRVRGREATSDLYEFEVWLETPFDSTKSTALPQGVLIDLLKPDAEAQLTMAPAREQFVHGVLRHIETVSSAHNSPIVYRAVLVPRMWFLTQTFRSRVYLQQSVKDIVAAVLQEYGLNAGDDFEWKLSANPPTRPYVVQYEETDYNFVCRLLEDEGIFFVFDQGPTSEKILFADSKNAFRPLEKFDALVYEPDTNREGSCTDIAQNLRTIPHSLFVRDYNYRAPAATLQNSSAESVDEDSVHGKQVLYNQLGEHGTTSNDAKPVARRRAEQLRTQKETYSAGTTVWGMHPGHSFHLDNHWSEEWPKDFYVTEAWHDVTQAGSGQGGNSGYTNRLVLLPDTIPEFHPARVTPKPRIAGLITAVINSPEGSEGTGAPIDDEGKYHVIMPWDTLGTGSLAIPMLSPYSGPPNYGMHFPLHKGTEVLVGHLDGDPDRPYIVGAVPNPRNGSPVTKKNATQSMIRTRSWIEVEFEDDAV